MQTSRDDRLQQLENWLATEAGMGKFSIVPASADASFRRYFRLTLPNGRSFIAMDAPPRQEDCRPFVDVTRRLENVGVNVPHIYASSIDQGFLLLDDLGKSDYLQHLSPNSVDNLYSPAIGALHKIQQADCNGLPDYDENLLQTELDLFTDWFIGIHLQIELTAQRRQILDEVQRILIQNAVEQPQVFVHRDYHSRNLMVTDTPSMPGIIDYQDAVIGPITYDLVSLLRDCYINWPDQQVKGWALQFHTQLTGNGRLQDVDQSTFLRWFDLMGIQRHLKAIGIFARLNHRDGKSGYLNDIPRTLGYILDIGGHYPEIRPLVSLLGDLQIPEKLAAS